jgi:competence protein ComEC
LLRSHNKITRIETLASIKSPRWLHWLPKLQLLKWLCWFLFAWSLALLHGHYLISQQFDDNQFSRECQLSGWVIGLPKNTIAYSRVTIKIDELHCAKIAVALSKANLALYRSNINLNAGDKLTAQVKLKAPRSNYSEGAFDVQLWAISNGINANGYIKKIIELKRADNSFYAIRDNLKRWIKNLPISATSSHTILALVLGDKSYISDQQWQQMRNTGTVHLMIVSGLHIGIMLIIGWWISFILTACLNAFKYPFITHFYPEIGALGLSFIYVLLSGASLSTQRAWLMAFVLIAGKWLIIRFSLWERWWLALTLIVTFAPLSVMHSGLWLSFAAVAGLITLQGYKTSKNKYLTLFNSQWLVWIALMPLLLLQFQQISLISPLINIIAISYVTLLLFSLTITLPLAAVGWYLPIQIIAKSLDYFWQILDTTQKVASTFIIETQILPVSAIILIAASCLLLALPLNGRAKTLLFVCWIVLFYPPKTKILKKGEFQLTLVDVGQGLAVIVQTAKHSMLFDTGASYRSPDGSNNGFSYYNATVKPALDALQIKVLNRLVISHTDNDHSGGLTNVVKDFSIAKIDSEIKVAHRNDVRQCVSNGTWHWDGVNFHYRQPKVSHFKKPNNRSCVLELGNSACKILIMADAEQKIEKILLKSKLNALKSILIVGHHGSNTSTNKYFLQREKFKIALISNGYKNRYNHPHPNVLARLSDAKIQIFRTDLNGSIKITSSVNNCSVDSYKENHMRYWW